MAHHIEPGTNETYCGTFADVDFCEPCHRGVLDAARERAELPPLTNEQYAKVKSYKGKMMLSVTRIGFAS